MFAQLFAKECFQFFDVLFEVFGHQGFDIGAKILNQLVHCPHIFETFKIAIHDRGQKANAAVGTGFVGKEFGHDIAQGRLFGQAADQRCDNPLQGFFAFGGFVESDDDLGDGFGFFDRIFVVHGHE